MYKFFYNKIFRFLTSCNYNGDCAFEINQIEFIKKKFSFELDSHNKDRIFWRAISQYRVQSLSRSLVSLVLANVIALFLLIRFLFLVKFSKSKSARIPCTYLKINNHPAYFTPSSINPETKESFIGMKYLRFNDLLFVFKLFFKNMAFYPELMYKFLDWICSTRPNLDIYKPQYLLQYCEYSATSSLRKLFLNNEDVLIANISHGEESISGRNAFSTFDRYYAWIISPESIYNLMSVEFEQFFSFNPCERINKVREVTSLNCLGFLWPVYNDVDFDLLCKKINFLSLSYKIIIRPHPNPSNRNNFDFYSSSLNAIISNEYEDIHDFIDRCSFVIGYMSAVLVQAALRERRTIYLKDRYLNSLMKFHKYYAEVDAIELENINLKFA